MRWIQQSRRRRTVTRAIAPVCLMDALEARQMFSGESIAHALPPVLANVASPTANSLTLNQYFTDSVLPGTLATFSTNEGSIQVALTDAATPQTVANFINYVDSGEYNGTIFHRSVDLNTGQGATPSAPATIIQGGGYNISNGSLNHIPTNGTVPDEYTTEILKDTAGTLAMAKTSQANSGTSEWYFNVSDNTELDPPTTDSNGIATSYTVFGNVLSGSSVISTIAALPTYDIGNGLTTVPVGGLAAGASPTNNNLVFVNSITTAPGTSYTATSSNKALVTPVVANGVLSFSYSSTLFGTAEITVTGTNLDGTSTSTVVDVTVPNPATPTAGPVAGDITAPFTQTGTTGNFAVATSGTDSAAALDPSTVTIVTQPAHGTATVDPTTGHIIYTPAAGYLGADALTYTIADTNGSVSNVATLTLIAVPGPVTVTIGTATAKSLTYTEPDGVVAHMSIATGTATITFTDYRVDLKTVKGVVTATGAGTLITGIHVVDRAFEATLTVTANGPIQLSSITDAAHLSINAPTATLTGTSSIGSSNVFHFAALVNANLSFSSSPVGINLFVPLVNNTSITSTGAITSIHSKQWLNSNGGTYTITAPAIGDLEVTGTFDDALNLSGTGYALFRANVLKPTATWGLSGSVFNATIGTPGSAWALNANGVISTLTVKGNFANNIQAAAINNMSVSGTTTGATIQTDATFSSKVNQINHISFRGAISNTVVFSAGNIGTITAPSMTNSRIYAGVTLKAAEAGSLAASATDLTNNARITSVALGSGKAAFANSLISADILGSLKLGKISTSNGGTPEGVSAHTLSAINGTLVPGGSLKAGAAQLKTATALAAYEKLAKLTLGDFQINLF